MPDLLDDLRQLAGQAGEPVGLEGLAVARRRRERRRRATAAVVGLAVMAAASVFLLATFRESRAPKPADSPPTGWSTYTDPYGWTIDVPDGWQTNVFAKSSDTNPGAQFIGSNMSVQVGIEPAPSVSQAPDLKLPPGLTLPPSNDSAFPLNAGALLSNVEGGLGGQFNGDGQRFDVLVLSPSLPGPLPKTDVSILDHMIGSITFEPWTVGDVRNGWEAIATPTEDVSWITVRGGTYILFRTPDGYQLKGSISCGGKPPSKTSTTPDGFAVLDCPDGSTWETDAPGSSGGSGIATSSNDPPPEWPVVTAHDGTLIAFVIPGYFPPGTGGAS